MKSKTYSKLQVIALRLVFHADLFTDEDWAHLRDVGVELTPTTMEEDALIGFVNVSFDDWSYIDQKESRHDADRMPAEVRIVFEQTQDGSRKLTGKVECGFFADDTVIIRQLDYIVGW